MAKDIELAFLNRQLTSHAASPQQLAAMDELRLRAKVFGEGILANCPGGRERELAVQHLEETLMWSIKSVVLG